MQNLRLESLNETPPPRRYANIWMDPQTNKLVFGMEFDTYKEAATSNRYDAKYNVRVGTVSYDEGTRVDNR